MRPRRRWWETVPLAITLHIEVHLCHYAQVFKDNSFYLHRGEPSISKPKDMTLDTRIEGCQNRILRKAGDINPKTIYRFSLTPAQLHHIPGYELILSNMVII